MPSSEFAYTEREDSNHLVSRCWRKRLNNVRLPRNRCTPQKTMFVVMVLNCVDEVTQCSHRIMNHRRRDLL